MANQCVQREIRLVFDCVIDTQVINFSDLIKKHTENIAQVNHVTANIIIPAHLRVVVIDDLADFGILRSDVTFMLKEQSSLNFTFSLMKSFSCCGSSCEQSCKCPVIGVDKKVRFVLQEPGAYVDAKGICFGRQKRSFAFKTIQEHCASDTKSSVVIKGVLDDQAVFMSDNLVRVEKNLHHVHACQINKNILLSDQARVVSLPKLEVLSDKVNCSHGAVISRLREEDLFYMQSRGVSPQIARLLLIDSFLAG